MVNKLDLQRHAYTVWNKARLETEYPQMPIHFDYLGTSYCIAHTKVESNGERILYVLDLDATTIKL